MAIKRLKQKVASFPRLGVLRKGAPKSGRGKDTKIGKDLSYFRFDTDDQAALEDFRTAYGDEPRDIDVFLPYPTADENFSSWQENWLAGGLQHRCDGETCVRHLLPDGTYSEEPVPCPGGCKEVGRLMIIIPQLRRMAYVTVLTHGINDIIELDNNLRAIEGWNGTLQGVPLVLRRKERNISTPGPGGKRVSRPKWMLSLEAKPEWVALQIQKMENKALEVSAQPLRIAATVDDEPEVIRYTAAEYIEEHGDDDGHEASQNEVVQPVQTKAKKQPAKRQTKPVVSPITEQQTKALHAAGNTCYGKDKWPEERKRLVELITKGRTDSSAKLTTDEASTLIEGIRKKIHDVPDVAPPVTDAVPQDVKFQ